MENPSAVEKIDTLLNHFRRVSLVEKIFFTQNLKTMIKSGLPMADALSSLAAETENKKFSSILNETKEDIMKGNALYQSLKKWPRVFSPVFINMIQIGEESGSLDSVLDQLTIQMKKTHTLTRKVKGALTYPTVVVAAMILISIFMFTFVVPKLMTIFLDVDIKLPLATRILMGLGNFFSQNIIFIVIGLIIIIIAVWRLLKTKKGAYWFDSLILKLPVFSSISKKINLAKFCRTLGALIKTDIPIVRALEITAPTLSNSLFREALNKAREAVKKGGSIGETLKNEPKLFPQTTIQMILVGEKSGTLEEVMEQTALFYENDVDEIMSNLPSLIEPILIVILGVGVAGIALAVILPIYTLTQSF